MDLKEFVKESLVQISKGIEDANLELADSGAMINPLHITVNSDKSQGYGRTGQPQSDIAGITRVVEKVVFDVAVVAESGNSAGGGLKLSIASIGVNADAKEESKDKSESRIKFSIPVVFPGVTSSL